MGEKKKKCLTLFINEYRTFVVEVCFSRSDCDEEEAFFLDSWNKFLVFTRVSFEIHNFFFKRV